MTVIVQVVDHEAQQQHHARLDESMPHQYSTSQHLGVVAGFTSHNYPCDCVQIFDHQAEVYLSHLGSHARLMRHLVPGAGQEGTQDLSSVVEPDQAKVESALQVPLLFF